MSDVLRRLRTGVREVRALYEDVRAPVFARQDWQGTTFARRTLGDGVEVEVWYLAEHFLVAWHDWQGLCKRWLRYFGQPTERFPQSWGTLDANCHGLADRLCGDGRLDAIVAGSWLHGPTAEALTHDAEEPSAKSIYHEIVVNHRRLSLLANGESPVARSEEQEMRRVAAKGPTWPECRDVAGRLNARVASAWTELPRQVREDTLWHLRQYQRANLLATWLAAATAPRAGQPQSALLHVLGKEQTVTPNIDQFVRLLNVQEDRQVAARVLLRLWEAIAEFGYAEFVEDVTSGEFLGGDDSPVGSDAINLIPSKNKGTGCTILLAVSRGSDKRSPLGFPKIMAQVKAHLIEYAGKTQMVLFLCDNWSPTTLDDHLDELRAHHRRGVRFLFLMVGTPGRVLAPVAVDLGLTP